MQSIHVTADGDYELVHSNGSLLRLDQGKGYRLAVGVRGTTLGTGDPVASVEYTPNGGDDWAALQGLEALSIGDTVQIDWPASGFRVVLDGATSPDFYIDYGLGS
jgi:hypothetical protein